MVLFKNVKVVTESGIVGADVLTNEEKIADIAENIECENAEVTDGKGCYLSAGFIDLHVHGGGGYSAMGGKDAVLGMARAHAKYGATSILPTTLASPLCGLSEAIDGIRLAQKENPNILGVHLEGPFLSPEMCGAQNTDNILSPAETEYAEFLDKYADTIKITGAAPEQDGGMLLGDELKKRGIVASIAHSSGDYDAALEALKHGYSDITHIYNACTSCFKKGAFRYAGTVEAALSEDGFTVQAISDLRHLPLGVLRLIYKCKGADKMYLISDGLEYSAMEIAEGKKFVQKNGVEVIYDDGVMKLTDLSRLAGSTATADRLVRNMYKYVGVPLCEAVKMMTLTPARIIGLENKKGKIEKGFDADIILFDENVNIQRVMINGNFV